MRKLVMSTSIGDVRVDDIKAKRIVTEDLVLDRVPGLAAVGGLDEPGLGSNGAETATNSPSEGFSSPSHLDQRKATVGGVGGPEGAIPGLKNIY